VCGNLAAGISQKCFWRKEHTLPKLTVFGKVRMPRPIRSKENHRGYRVTPITILGKAPKEAAGPSAQRAILGRENRHTILRLGLRERWRQRFAALLQPIAALAISTVVQFADYAKNPVPRPWKLRRPARRYPLVLMPN
jgi:hypothetical protein